VSSLGGDLTTIEQEGDSDFWEESPALWDVVLIGQQPSNQKKAQSGLRQMPGAAHVETKFSVGVQVNHPAGAVGAYYLALGYEPEEFTVTLTMWTPQQWEAWVEIRRSLVPDPKSFAHAPDALGVLRRAPAAFAIRHALLAAHGITQCVFKSINESTPAQGDAFVATLECVEYRAAKPLPAVKYQAPPESHVQGALDRPAAPTGPGPVNTMR
jgi:hypothetical protein